MPSVGRKIRPAVPAAGRFANTSFVTLSARKPARPPFVRMSVTVAPSLWLAPVVPSSPRAMVKVAPLTAVTLISSESISTRNVPEDGNSAAEATIIDVAPAEMLPPFPESVVCALLANSSIGLLLAHHPHDSVDANGGGHADAQALAALGDQLIGVAGLPEEALLRVDLFGDGHVARVRGLGRRGVLGRGLEGLAVRVVPLADVLGRLGSGGRLAHHLDQNGDARVAHPVEGDGDFLDLDALLGRRHELEQRLGAVPRGDLGRLNGDVDASHGLAPLLDEEKGPYLAQ